MSVSEDSKRDITVLLTTSTKKQKDLSKCIIWQIDDKKKTSATSENGRQKIVETSKLLKHDIVDKEHSFVYHLKCYRPYILKGNRVKPSEGDKENENDKETLKYQKNDKKDLAA